jgi:hypothetical protein
MTLNGGVPVRRDVKDFFPAAGRLKGVMFILRIFAMQNFTSRTRYREIFNGILHKYQYVIQQYFLDPLKIVRKSDRRAHIRNPTFTHVGKIKTATRFLVAVFILCRYDL